MYTDPPCVHTDRPRVYTHSARVCTDRPDVYAPRQPSTPPRALLFIREPRNKKPRVFGSGAHEHRKSGSHAQHQPLPATSERPHLVPPRLKTVPCGGRRSRLEPEDRSCGLTDRFLTALKAEGRGNAKEEDPLCDPPPRRRQRQKGSQDILQSRGAGPVVPCPRNEFA